MNSYPSNYNHMYGYGYEERVEYDEIGCPHIRKMKSMQAGELWTFGMGAFAIVLIIAVVIYYKCFEKPSRRRY